MNDLDKALADIDTIRAQLARRTPFSGFGPATLAATAGLALATATGQALWLDHPTDRPVTFFALWIGTAVAALACIAFEMVARSRRLHSGLADAMILDAADRFLPAGAVGACLGLVLLRFCPENLWMLPGLWQILVGMGLFAACSALPRAVAVVGACYVLGGLGVLSLACADHALDPWRMGLPFVAGQALLALVMHRFGGGCDEAARP